MSTRYLVVCTLYHSTIIQYVTVEQPDDRRSFGDGDRRPDQDQEREKISLFI